MGVTCYLLLSTCYLLNVTYYLIVDCACYLIVSVWYWLSETCYCLPIFVSFCSCSATRSCWHIRNFLGNFKHRKLKLKPALSWCLSWGHSDYCPLGNIFSLVVILIFHINMYFLIFLIRLSFFCVLILLHKNGQNS